MFLQRDQTQVSLSQVGVWFIGEYGEELLESHYDQQRQQQLDAVSEDAILDLLESVLNNNANDSTTKSICVSPRFIHSHDSDGSGQIV